MSFFLSKLFPGWFKSKRGGKRGYTTKDGPHAIWVYVQCARCGEKIAVRLSTTAELQKREGLEAEIGAGEYFVRKVIVGSQCYERIEAVIDFDARFNVVGSEIKNGKLITAEEYHKEGEL